ncbi:MAG: hypothetical protein ACL7BU_08230 [Candidatus Phlomobacter fragariae]
MKKLKIGVFFDGTGNNAYNTKKDIPESEKYFTKNTNKQTNMKLMIKLLMIHF